MPKTNYSSELAKLRKSGAVSPKSSSAKSLNSILKKMYEVSEDIKSSIPKMASEDGATSSITGGGVVKNTGVTTSQNTPTIPESQGISAEIPTPKDAYTPKTAAGEGARIKSSITNALKPKYGEIGAKGIFDNVSDEAVERNINTAVSAVNANLRGGSVTPETLISYPNMQDGLALFYAASESGDKNAAKMAYEAVYTEGDKIVSVYSDEDASNRKTSSFYDDYLEKLNVQENGILDDYGVVKPENKTVFDILGETMKNVVSPNYSNRKKYNETSNVYYGIAVEMKDGKFPDLEDGDLTKKQIIETLGIQEKDFVEDVEELEKGWKSLAKFGSWGDMKPVLLDMIDHFMDGNGEDYTNDTLTKVVSKNKVTKSFMSDFSNVFNDFVTRYKGDIGAFANSKVFRDALKADDVYLSKYAYEGLDTFKGLGLAIHGWTVGEVNVKSFDLEADGTYNGELEFRFIDNFGLDKDDVGDFFGQKGFDYWFILQHYDKFQGKYKPFRTIVTIDYPISGKINN